MKSWMALLFLGLAAILAGRNIQAQETREMRASTAAVKKQIVAIVEAQLAAFRKEDVAKAYSYASRSLRAQRPLRIFSAIVEANYPEIWANTRAEFGLVHDDGERATILVVVHTQEDRASYDFLLVKERAGWRIEGVLRHAPAKGSQV